MRLCINSLFINGLFNLSSVLVIVYSFRLSAFRGKLAAGELLLEMAAKLEKKSIY